MPTRIDSHVHFWQLARGDYRWITPDMTALLHDFGPDDLRPHLDAAGIDQIILVQAADTVAETEFLLSQAEACDLVAGVVGWIDMAAPDARATLERLRQNPYLKGIRPMIHDIPDVDWMLSDDLTPAFRAVIELDLSFDCLVKPPHLKNLLKLLTRHAELRAIICHGAKPDIASGAFDNWATDMQRLAEETGAFCKLSGLITEAGPDWTAQTLRPSVEHLLGIFGPQRLIWGSDWPVLTLAASYEDWWQATNTLLAGLTEADKDSIFGGNARRAYRL